MTGPLAAERGMRFTGSLAGGPGRALLRHLLPQPPAIDGSSLLERAQPGLEARDPRLAAGRDRSRHPGSPRPGQLPLETPAARHQQPERERHEQQEESSQRDPAPTGEQGEAGEQADLSARRILGRHPEHPLPEAFRRLEALEARRTVEIVGLERVPLAVAQAAGEVGLGEAVLFDVAMIHRGHPACLSNSSL